MSKTLKNKAASMALFATMMAVGTLPLAAQAPQGFFLEGTQDVSENSVVEKTSVKSAGSEQVTIGGTVYEAEKKDR